MEKEITIYQQNVDGTIKLPVWQTSVQTPYSAKANIDVNIIKAQIEIELHAMDKSLLYSGLGIDVEWRDDINSYAYHQHDPDLVGKNVLLSTSFRFDNKYYWVVTITHTQPK